MAEMQGAPAPEGGESGGGGIAEVLQGLDAGLSKVTQALSQGSAPEEAKAAFQAALQAFRQGLEILTSGDGDPQRQAAQTTTPEQGANPNAVPMGHGRPA